MRVCVCACVRVRVRMRVRVRVRVRVACAYVSHKRDAGGIKPRSGLQVGSIRISEEKGWASRFFFFKYLVCVSSYVW